jgi:NADH-quinone oxidoreductase subunit N
MTSLDFSTILPEVVLAAYALIALLAGAYFGKDKLAATPAVGHGRRVS